MFPDHIIQHGVHTGINQQELQNEMLQYTRYYPFNACWQKVSVQRNIEGLVKQAEQKKETDK